MVVHNIDYVKERIALMPKLRRINVYENFVNPKNKINLMKSTVFDAVDKNLQIDHWVAKNKGNYTFEYSPGGFCDYVTTLEPGEQPTTLNGTEPMANMGIPTEEMIQAQVQKILENERLKMRVQQLEEEQEQNDMWGQRFGAALNMVIDRFIPGQNQTMQVEPTLNGTDLNSTEAALVILVEQFGEEWLQKFAAKIQADPSLVKQIKAFFS